MSVKNEIWCETGQVKLEFLIDHTPELQESGLFAGLCALTEQIRSAHAAVDNPAVAALKQSEVYQDAVCAIEGAGISAAGGLPL